MALYHISLLTIRCSQLTVNVKYSVYVYRLGTSCVKMVATVGGTCISILDDPLIPVGHFGDFRKT